MQVVVTACDANGNVDMADLAAKCEQHSANLACIMITYPSTHGVFETQVKELCKLVHDHGGRVDRKSTRLNSSHLVISYAVFCLKKKKTLRTSSCTAYSSSWRQR